MKTIDYIITALKARGEKMHYQEIATAILHLGWTTNTRTPGSMVASYISQHITREGDASEIARLGDGFYIYTGLDDEPVTNTSGEDANPFPFPEDEDLDLPWLTDEESFDLPTTHNTLPEPFATFLVAPTDAAPFAENSISDLALRTICQTLREPDTDLNRTTLRTLAEHLCDFLHAEYTAQAQAAETVNFVALRRSALDEIVNRWLAYRNPLAYRLTRLIVTDPADLAARILAAAHILRDAAPQGPFLDHLVQHVTENLPRAESVPDAVWLDAKTRKQIAVLASLHGCEPEDLIAKLVWEHTGQIGYADLSG